MIRQPPNDAHCHPRHDTCVDRPWFAFNSSKGTLTGKEAFIQSILNLAMVGQTIRERSVLMEGDVAVVFGTAELRFAAPGKEETVQNLRYTSTYVKRQGQWRLLALQMQQRAPQ